MSDTKSNDDENKTTPDTTSVNPENCNGGVNADVLKVLKDTAEILNFFLENRNFNSEASSQHGTSVTTIQEELRKCSSDSNEFTANNESSLLPKNSGSNNTAQSIEEIIKIVARTFQSENLAVDSNTVVEDDAILCEAQQKSDTEFVKESKARDDNKNELASPIEDAASKIIGISQSNESGVCSQNLSFVGISGSDDSIPKSFKKLINFSPANMDNSSYPVDLFSNNLNGYPKKATEESHQLSTLEPTVSTMGREILLRNEGPDNKKNNILQLPPETIPNTPSYCEKEIVGDDVAKRHAHILCECDQAGVAGGAVPMVTSFTRSESQLNHLDDNNVASPDKKIPISKSRSSIESLSSKGASLISKLSNLTKREKISSSSRTEKNRSLVSSEHEENVEEVKTPRSISFKTSASFLDKNEDDDNSHNNKKESDESGKTLRFEEDISKQERRSKKLASDFSKLVARFAEEVSTISEIDNAMGQMSAIDHLYKHITTLKNMAQEIKAHQRSSHSGIIDSQKDDSPSSTEPNKSRTKDNKIYIKFLPSKSSIKKKKNSDSEAQTDRNETSSNPNGSVSGKTLKPTTTVNENSPKNADSVDGMFIPSMDEPPKMDEDDDEDALDITITFPELQRTLEQEEDSHLSVCFSNISAEALGRLKRCPKEFTLRMDFVQGKMFFQTGKSPANNFTIGPDLKITECIIDNKKSDIINIKPSTECLYASQIIPVEGEIGKESLKILKSTDSELFKVVSLPYVNKRNSASTKSCITFKSVRRISSESLLEDRTHYKSMPQIPSLTKIVEEPVLENCVSGIRAAMINSERKPRIRNLQKRRGNASLDKMMYDMP